jgi:hypothetical protein
MRVKQADEAVFAATSRCCRQPQRGADATHQLVHCATSKVGDRFENKQKNSPNENDLPPFAVEGKTVS